MLGFEMLGVVEKFYSPVGLIDLMQGCDRWEVKVSELGFVALVDTMPRLVPPGLWGDTAVVQAARVSYRGSGAKTPADDTGLIRRLMRDCHTSPFEMVEFKFHCKMPIFVARQWIRHRTANVNEVSGRYSIMKDEFYKPDLTDVRAQSKTNKQGSEGQVTELVAIQFLEYLDRAEASYHDYKNLVEAGIAKEQARMGLPLSLFTEWYWKIDLHNLLHFLGLRLDPHAQKEIRVYAKAMYDMIAEIVPACCDAFADYKLNAITLSALEISAIKNNGAVPDVNVITNKTEREQFKAKLDMLGLPYDHS